MEPNLFLRHSHTCLRACVSVSVCVDCLNIPSQRVENEIVDHGRQHVDDNYSKQPSNIFCSESSVMRNEDLQQERQLCSQLIFLTADARLFVPDRQTNTWTGRSTRPCFSCIMLSVRTAHLFAGFDRTILSSAPGGPLPVRKKSFVK